MKNASIKTKKTNGLVYVGTHVPKDVKAHLVAMAQQQDLSLSRLVKRILAAGVVHPQ